MSDQPTLPSLPEQDGVEFRHIAAHPGYCVGSDGSVWSCLVQVKLRIYRRGWIWVPGQTWKRRKPFLSGNYPCVSLSGKKRKNVHLLVLEAFVGPKPSGLVANHIDGNMRNPVLSNLEYVTQSQNCLHAFDTGLCRTSEEHHDAKLTNAEVREIRRLYAAGGTSYAKLAKQFGVFYTNIRAIVKGWTWFRLSQED